MRVNKQVIIKQSLDFLFEKKWMVAGYECHHDKKQRKAVGAFVASINEAHSRFHSSVKIHENNEGISPNFRLFVFDALM